MRAICPWDSTRSLGCGFPRKLGYGSYDALLSKYGTLIAATSTWLRR